jgi:phage baseplate assembly protein W
MAYVKSTRVDPRDLNKNTAIGVKIPFNAPGVFYSTFSTKEQIRYNVVNLVLTSKGERVENPNFGTNVRSQLFQQIDPSTFSDLELGLVEDIQTYIPNVRVTNVQFSQSGEYNDNTLLVSITYLILISNEIDTVTVNFE